jgi:hypothetical protein
MPAFHYDLIVCAETQEEADRVAIERVGYDEDYGFDYLIDVERADGQELMPMEVE